MSSACGKFILGGEHSVVVKGRALGFPVKSLSLTVEESQEFDGLKINNEKHPMSEFRKILEIRKILGASSTVRGISIQSTIPIGGGLGSSAALCTALAKLHLKGLPMEDLARSALQGERLFHGKPSGVDPFTIAVGRPIVYRASDQSWRALNTERFTQAGLCFVLKDTGLRHRTDEVIRAVTTVRSETPLIWEDLMDTLAQNAELMVKAFEESPTQGLGRLMNDSHFRLLQLGVSCETMDTVVEELRSQGALGAKLTGAGRGGFVLGLFRREDAEKLPREGVLIPEF